MTSSLVLYGVFAIALATFLALINYKPWASKRVFWGLTALRALTFSVLFLLLLNLQYTKNTIELIKPKLSVLVDNSESIKFINKDSTALELLEQLKTNAELAKKFDLQYFYFDTDLKFSDELVFDAPQTNIGKAISEVHELYKDEIAPILLISDGQQTVGTSYEYMANQFEQKIYPLVLGDTARYTDLRIKQINVNAYAFLDNTFPAEIFVQYNGTTDTTSVLEVFSGAKLVYREKINLSSENNTLIVSPKLKATQVGIQRYSARLRPLSDELIISNNRKPFALEVIDQKLNIALVSSQSHPDLRVFKSMVSNQKNYSIQRLTPEEFLKSSKDFAFVVLYQPNPSFADAYNFVKENNINTFTVAGPETDWAFLNRIQQHYAQEISQYKEAYQAVFNTNSDAFALAPLDFENFPPLQSDFGSVAIRMPHQVLLYKSVGGLETKNPLLFTYQAENTRHAVVLGSDLWKWRLKAYQLYNRFNDFDAFFNVVFQYLSTQKKADRLRVTHEAVFDGTEPIAVYAQLYDENFQFNPNAQLEIEISNPQLDRPITFSFAQSESGYKAELSSLNSGTYQYQVRTKDRKFVSSGQFEILAYNIETQFLNANYKAMNQLAITTGGQLFLENQYSGLLNELLKNSNYKTIQKISKKTVPLVDYKWLLLLLVLSLAAEWFIRKYNGYV